MSELSQVAISLGSIYLLLAIALIIDLFKGD